MKLLLVATTALVCVTTVVTAGALPERQTGSGYAGQDANQEFLCTFGFTLFASNSDSSAIWHRAATPVIGKGAAVNEIIVEDGPSQGIRPGGFTVAIYSSRSGHPGKKLVSRSATQSGCGRVEVPISPITLEQGKKYWVVQELKPCCSASDSMVWVYDKKRTHGAMSQSGYSSSDSRAPGPWKPLTGGVPFARVVNSADAVDVNGSLQSQAASNRPVFHADVPTNREGFGGNVPRYPP